MGGSSSGGPGRRPGTRRPRGGGGDNGPDGCPYKITASVSAPAPGIVAGTWLHVELDRSVVPSRVLVFDPAARAVVGSIAGIPNLNVLIDCLTRGVEYRAYVDHVSGGRVDITIVRQ